ncbi:MAG: hypothetical protein RIS64_725 [Bacteroidota bacterium]|jgi:hypothetical protein
MTKKNGNIFPADFADFSADLRGFLKIKFGKPA